MANTKITDLVSATAASGDEFAINDVTDTSDKKVTAGSIVDIITGDITVNSSGVSALAANSVDSAELVDGGVDLSHMSVNSIDSDQYVDGSIDTAHLANSQVTVGKMAANSIDSDQYVDGSIDLIHMSVNSIDSDQYVDGSIDSVHLAAAVFSTITGLGTQSQDMEFGGNNIQNGGVIFLKEQAEADADVSTEGQIWVDNTTPQQLKFTDEDGTDTNLLTGTGDDLGDHTATEALKMAGFNIENIGGTSLKAVSSDIAFQDDTLNASTLVRVSPNGTGEAVFTVFNTDWVASQSNWEGMEFKTDANIMKLRTAAAGTGTIRNIEFVDNVTTRMTLVVGAGMQMNSDVDFSGNNLNNGGVIFLTEQAEADADVAGKGQIWVDLATPNKLFFTDDAGTDFDLTLTGGINNIVEDVTPQLGADLDCNAFDLNLDASTMISFDTGTQAQKIVGDAGGLTHTVPNADTHDFIVDATTVVAIAETGVTLTGTLAVSGILDTLDIETATVSARDGALAITIADTTGVSTFVSGAVLVAPVLGTPASGTLTNCTGLPITGITSSTSAEFATLCSDETGSSLLVFNTSPTLVTPLLGTPTSGVMTNMTGLVNAGIVDDTITLTKLVPGTKGEVIGTD